EAAYLGCVVGIAARIRCVGLVARGVLGAPLHHAERRVGARKGVGAIGPDQRVDQLGDVGRRPRHAGVGGCCNATVGGGIAAAAAAATAAAAVVLPAVATRNACRMAAPRRKR